MTFLLRHLRNPNDTWDSRPSISHHGGETRDICVQFGKRVPGLPKEYGWRQLDLAEQAGISTNYVSDLELRKKEARRQSLVDALENSHLVPEVNARAVGAAMSYYAKPSI
jgi:hypothetical protein